MNKEKILSSRSEKISNRILGGWFFITIAIAYGANIFGINIINCFICDFLSGIIPAVNKWPTRTDFYNEAKIIWVFLPISSIFIFLIFVTSIKEINYNAYSISVIAVFLFLFCLTITITIFGLPDSSGASSESNGFFISFFSKTLVGMAMISWACWMTLVISIFYLMHFIVNIFY